MDRASGLTLARRQTERDPAELPGHRKQHRLWSASRGSILFLEGLLVTGADAPLTARGGQCCPIPGSTPQVCGSSAAARTRPQAQPAAGAGRQKSSAEPEGSSELSLTSPQPGSHRGPFLLQNSPEKGRKREKKKKESIAHSELLSSAIPTAFYCPEEEEREPWKGELAKAFNVFTSLTEQKVPKNL